MNEGWMIEILRLKNKKEERKNNKKHKKQKKLSMNPF